jgi:FKBP-type peptidyl-prolyl cis-trans isomerase FkpA
MLSVTMITLMLNLLVIGCSKDQPVTEVEPRVTSTVGPADPRERTSPGAVEYPDAEFSESASGLRYRILRDGSDRKPKATDIVISHYKGWLDDGTIFDSSYRVGDPIDFPLSRVIPGWTEGLQLIGEGGMIELDIPHTLGYGEEGSPPVIPPKARLHFIVELINIR